MLLSLGATLWEDTKGAPFGAIGDSVRVDSLEIEPETRILAHWMHLGRGPGNTCQREESRMGKEWLNKDGTVQVSPWPDPCALDCRHLYWRQDIPSLAIGTRNGAADTTSRHHLDHEKGA